MKHVLGAVFYIGSTLPAVPGQTALRDVDTGQKRSRTGRN